MSCKDVIGDLYSIFPSENRKKHWEEAGLDVLSKSVEHVQRKVNHLLQDDRFKNAVDESQPVSTFMSYDTFDF